MSDTHSLGMTRNRGASLIECLVALAVLAIGSAANATWVMQSMATHARASRLHAAIAIASSLEARMRRNRGVALEGGYGDATYARFVDCSIACDARSLAALDLHAFQQALARHVGAAASGSVRCGTTGCVIDIAWQRVVILSWPFRP